jgi:hypothetical protein
MMLRDGRGRECRGEEGKKGVRASELGCHGGASLIELGLA